MKLISSGVLALTLWSGMGTFYVHAQSVRFQDLPAAVQRTINTQAGASGIASIQRATRRGAPVYEVRLSGGADSRPFYVSEAGALVNMTDVISSGRATTITPQGSSRKGNFRELPTAVQNTVRGQAGIARVEDIDIVTRNGQTNYNVAFKREGKNVELWLDANGNLLNDGLGTAQASAASPQRSHLAAASKVTFNELPPAAQSAIRTYAKGAEIEDIDRGTLQGRTVYEAAFKHNGNNIELRVAEDGTLVRDDVNDRFLADIGQAPGGSAGGIASTSPAGVGTSWGAAAPRGPLTGGAKVSFRDMPTAVRNTVRTYAGMARVEDIDRGTVDGQPVYEVAFKNGTQNVELRVAEDGSLVRDQENERFITQFGRQTPPGEVGRAPIWQVLKGSGSSNPGQLGTRKPFAYGQLPSAVQNTMRAEAGTAAIENIEQGTLDGRTVYQATVKRNGRDTMIRVTEDGTVLQ